MIVNERTLKSTPAPKPPFLLITGGSEAGVLFFIAKIKLFLKKISVFRHK
ncbi:hypothetical protein LPL9_2895 [Lacticaseibacillus paracasei]|nr:hypothetical protein LPL9_2895 [Lacticaseibacillus paracasei]QHV90640.1 hypothetical protein EOK76_g0150 [Lacticaseibacillus paracasei]